MFATLTVLAPSTTALTICISDLLQGDWRVQRAWSEIQRTQKAVVRQGSLCGHATAAVSPYTHANRYMFQNGPVDSSRVLVRASCGHTRCYRVVRVGSVRQGFSEGRDVSMCPAHQGHYVYFSRHVSHFYNVLLHIGYHGVVVWDWCDVPNHPHMHWDASIFWTTRYIDLRLMVQYMTLQTVDVTGAAAPARQSFKYI